MTPKTLIRSALLVLVLGSVAYVVLRPYVARPATPVDTTPTQLRANTELVVYYFSMGKECTTCDQIEAWTRESVQKHFAADLDSGRIVWSKVDLDEPGNAHYATEYELFTKSVILARMDKGHEVRWTNLRDVWNLVGDQPAFENYIRSQIQAVLDEAP